MLLDSLGLYLDAFEGGYYELREAIIDGRQYGTITSITRACSTPSSWPFYPLSTGNVWRYKISFNGGVWGHNYETIFDSLEIQGECSWEKRTQEYTGGQSSTFLRQEDSTLIVERPSLGQNEPLRHLYKIDAEVGEAWLVESSSDSSYKFWGKLESNDSTEIFGEIGPSKRYRFWRETNGNLGSEWFIVLTEDLGLTQLRGGDGGVDFQDIDLVGAIIDGVEYGDPVSVDRVEREIPIPDVFITNYPNPFTTETTIEVDLRGFTSKQLVQIAVYNLSGQRVLSPSSMLTSCNVP